MSAHFVSGLFRDGYSKRLCTGISMGSCGMHRILLAHPHSITLRQRFPINWRNCKISCTTAKKDRVRESVRPFPYRQSIFLSFKKYKFLMVSLLDKFMLTFVEEAESSTDMINHPSQHEKLTLSPMMPLVKATAIKEV